MERLLDCDPETGEEVWFYVDPVTRRRVIRTRHPDVAPWLDLNKRAQAEQDRGWSRSRDWRRVAVIPNIIAEKWLNELGVNIFDRNHDRAVRRLLRDPDWRWLRTSPGRI